MTDNTIRLTPGCINVSRRRFVATLRRMHAAKWGYRLVPPGAVTAPEPIVPEPPPALEPVVEERRLTPDEVAEVEQLRRESASRWTWKRLGERYGMDAYAVKLAVLGMERRA